MARPQKDNLDYFPHDCKASSDEKLEILEIKYPNGAGYAWYFKTLERIYFHLGKLDVSAEETKQILCRNLNINAEEIISYAVKIGLFNKKEYEENNILTSDRIKTAVIPVIIKREKMAELYQKRISAAETIQKTIVSPERTHIVEESRDRVEIEYKKKERNIIPPKIELVKKYCTDRKNNVSYQKFYDFYESKNWFVGKNKMKDWQASVRTWEQTTNNQQPTSFNNPMCDTL